MSNRYKKQEYSKNQVKKAGKIFAKGEASAKELESALDIINNWRAVHAYPLQVIYVNLRKRAPEDAIVAQRLKRLYSITEKLKRFPQMSLTTMQDIGGCRVILNSIEDVYEFVNKIKHSQWKHKYISEDNYIANPKDDGYRCYHLVYAYHSNKNKDYNGLFIEIQVRTKYQHMWATAVETIDEVDSDKIKIGRGTKANRQFLLIASRLLQLYEENGYDVDKVRQSDYADQMRSFEKENHTLAHLRAIKATEVVYSDFDGTVDTGYFIMISQNAIGKTKVFYYPHNNIDKATEFYDTFESRKHKDEDIVLVSTSSVDSLRKAYPNYFSDIGDFLKLMQDFIVT